MSSGTGVRGLALVLVATKAAACSEVTEPAPRARLVPASDAVALQCAADAPAPVALHETPPGRLGPCGHLAVRSPEGALTLFEPDLVTQQALPSEDIPRIQFGPTGQLLLAGGFLHRLRSDASEALGPEPEGPFQQAFFVDREGRPGLYRVDVEARALARWTGAEWRFVAPMRFVGAALGPLLIGTSAENRLAVVDVVSTERIVFDELSLALDYPRQVTYFVAEPNLLVFEEGREVAAGDVLGYQTERTRMFDLSTGEAQGGLPFSMVQSGITAGRVFHDAEQTTYIDRNFDLSAFDWRPLGRASARVQDRLVDGRILAARGGQLLAAQPETGALSILEDEAQSFGSARFSLSEDGRVAAVVRDLDEPVTVDGAPQTLTELRVYAGEVRRFRARFLARDFELAWVGTTGLAVRGRPLVEGAAGLELRSLATRFYDIDGHPFAEWPGLVVDVAEAGNGLVVQAYQGTGVGDRPRALVLDPGGDVLDLGAHLGHPGEAAFLQVDARVERLHVQFVDAAGQRTAFSGATPDPSSAP